MRAGTKPGHADPQRPAGVWHSSWDWQELVGGKKEGERKRQGSWAEVKLGGLGTFVQNHSTNHYAQCQRHVPQKYAPKINQR